MADSIYAYAPGRTEIAGNHTDHQGGRVIAAAVSCGIEMELSSRADAKARIESEGFAPFEIDIAETAARFEERNTTASLVRGVVAGLRAAGSNVAGFDARVKSTVPSGGGLSSSAAFELALASGLVARARDQAEAVSPVELARIGQAAERDYFGKPCGLMDQLAVALGGVAAIDFADERQPAIERIPFDFEQHGLALCLIDTHCDHSRYTEAYAQVALDMNAVASLLGAQKLSQVPEGEFFERFEEVRHQLGDVAALRGLHYYHESHLVDARVQALCSGDVEAFLAYTRQSGASSAQYLQNVSTYDRMTQPAMIALALADRLLQGHGACRIHGGGFGGTVQAFVPLDDLDRFAGGIDAHLGVGSCKSFHIDSQGAHVR